METLLGARPAQLCLPLTDPSALAAARRAADRLAQTQGLDETAAGRVTNVVMEAGTNILKYGQDGEILLRGLGWDGHGGVEVLALDRGSGIADLAASMHNGASSSGTYGLGLGAMQRLADEFDIYSAPGRGTAIWMTVWTDSEAAARQPWQVGAVCQPMPGETTPGDSWALAMQPNAVTVLVADGLGHGPDAAVAAEAACDALARGPQLPLPALMTDLHGALRGTRGAAVALARLDRNSEQAAFTGIGNIAGSVIDGDERHQLVSHNGIVGSNMRKVQEFASPWPDHGLLLMHSDGMSSRWDLQQYPGLAACHPALVAGVLYRDFARRRDDVTVLAVRANRGG